MEDGAMAPEAYTLHDAIRAWVNKKAWCNSRCSRHCIFRVSKCGIIAANRFLSGVVLIMAAGFAIFN
jgi:hypothetical protein